MTAAVSSNRKHLLKQRLQYLFTQQNQTVFFPGLVQIRIEQLREKEEDKKKKKIRKGELKLSESREPRKVNICYVKS